MKSIKIITFFIVFIDQCSKIYVKTHFNYHENVEVFSWFHLTFIENPGMAYGVEFGGIFGKIILSFVRFLLIVVMIFYFYRWSKTNTSFYFITPASLLLAGAIGNLIDGMFYGLIFNKALTYDSLSKNWIPYSDLAELNFKGYAGLCEGVVVDMFRLPIFEGFFPDWIPIWGGEHFEFFKYIFNVADFSITIGAIWLLIFKNKSLPKEFLCK